MKLAKKKVMVGMSGGVDSSVAAALLSEMGYDVIGVTLKMWPLCAEDCDQYDKSSCCSVSDIEDARKVAAKLNIPHYVINAKKAFDKYVVQNFVSNYNEGLTPNPCIQCNKHIKFDFMLEKAKSMGVDYIATGHYAIIDFDDVSARFMLKTPSSPEKDQTYVLYTMTQYQLASTLMPLGKYAKWQVREIAQKYGLPTASKPDSQDICFIRKKNYGAFISRYSNCPVNPGHFVDHNGNVLGEHMGIMHYTIGQRKGLGISFGKPMFVTDIDPGENTITLGEYSQLFSKELVAHQLNWISIEDLNKPMHVCAKIRYNSAKSKAIIYPSSKNTVQVVFEEPQKAITPGQSVVFYDANRVVGGGIIKRI